MSSSDREPDPATKIDDLRDDREHILEVFRECLDEVAYKYQNGRVRDAEKEKVRISRFRALCKGISEYRKLVKDVEEDELEEWVEELDERLDEIQ